MNTQASSSPPAGTVRLAHLLALRFQELLESFDLGITLLGCSNNSPRTFASVPAGCIRLAGNSGSCGQELGFTAGPTLLQPQSARTQIISNALTLNFCIFAPLFIGLRNFELSNRQQYFCLVRPLHCLGERFGICREVLTHRHRGASLCGRGALLVRHGGRTADDECNREEEISVDGHYFQLPVMHILYSDSRRLMSPGSCLPFAKVHFRSSRHHTSGMSPALSFAISVLLHAAVGPML